MEMYEYCDVCEDLIELDADGEACSCEYILCPYGNAETDWQELNFHKMGDGDEIDH